MPTIRDNLLQAIAATEAFPERLLALHYYRKETDCGTMYCLAGLLTTVPHFAEQGLTLQRSERDPTWTLVTEGRKLNDILGYSAWFRLFAPRGAAEWDEQLLRDGTLTDKQLALARLRRQLEEYP